MIQIQAVLQQQRILLNSVTKENTQPEGHKAGLKKYVVNDPAESYFKETTSQIQCLDRIGLTSAGGVHQIQRNSELVWGFERKRWKTKSSNLDIEEENRATKKEGTRLGLFHELSDEIRLSLLIIAKLDAPKTRLTDRADLDKQRIETQRKRKY